MSEKTKREKEEQYFAEQEQKKRRELRKQLDEQKKVQEKEKKQNEHWMKCPKCGHDLEEKHFADICIDQCTHCEGVWLDEGELELLLEAKKAKGFFSKFMGSVRGKG